MHQKHIDNSMELLLIGIGKLCLIGYYNPLATIPQNWV